MSTVFLKTQQPKGIKLIRKATINANTKVNTDGILTIVLMLNICVYFLCVRYCVLLLSVCFLTFFYHLQ